MKNPLLRIENLQTSFRIQDRYHAAVDDVSLTVHENEIVAIVGESGCGKVHLPFPLCDCIMKQIQNYKGSLTIEIRTY